MTEFMQVTEGILRYELLIDGFIQHFRSLLLERHGERQSRPSRVLVRPSSASSAPTSAPVDTMRTTTSFLLKSSMRQFQRRHCICQTLIVPSVPGSSYCLCTVPLVLPNVDKSWTARPGVRQHSSPKARFPLVSCRTRR